VALVRDLTSEISRRTSEAADLRARLELTELAETSRREVLEQSLETERLLRAQAERERDELRRELEALTETSQAPETASEPRSGTDTPESTSEDTGGIEGIATPADVGGVQAATQSPERRSWWRRFFGFE